MVAHPLPLLDRPALEGARLIALDWLAHLVRASARLHKDPADAEALHDVRAHLTRLRATRRAYRSELGSAVGRRGVRELRVAHRALGPARDLDVQRAWLLAEQAHLPTEATLGVAWLLARIDARRTVLSPRLTKAVARHMDRHADVWRHALSRYVVTREVGEPLHEPTLASVVVQRLHHAVQRLRAAIDHAVHDAPGDTLPTFDALHRVRLHVKRVRALLAPWQHETSISTSLHQSLQPLLLSLSEAQEALGLMHDALVLARHVRKLSESRAVGAHDAKSIRAHGSPTNPTPEQPPTTLAWSLGAIAAHANGLAEEHRLAFVYGWLSEGSDVAFPEVAEAAEALARIARADQEIERKFLLREAPHTALSHAGVRIAQGWLPGERLRERLRRSVHPDGRVTWTRTVKVGTGIARLEIEEPADAMLFESLWPLTSSARVEKVRYTVADGAFRWEIDVFLDRDLVLAEVELPSTDTLVSFPDWLAPSVLREVTGEAAYVNANLARDIRRAPGAL